MASFFLITVYILYSTVYIVLYILFSYRFIIMIYVYCIPVLLKYFLSRAKKKILISWRAIDDPWCPGSSMEGSSWPGGGGVYVQIEQISLAGQKQTLAGHRRPFFALAGQIYLFTINSKSLAGHFFSPAGHEWPAGSYLRSAGVWSFDLTTGA